MAKKSLKNSLDDNTRTIDDKNIENNDVSLNKEDINSNKDKEKKKLFSILEVILLIILLIVSLLSFGSCLLQKDSSIKEIISQLIITIFSILFVSDVIKLHRKKKTLIVISTLLLISFLGINLLNSSFINNSSTIDDFSGKSLIEVVKWAKKNHVNVTEEYEYSDMIDEYKIISQSIPSGTSLKNIKDLKVSVSEGPNPSKEIIFPNMIGWNCDRVIEYVLDNHLSNVDVEFIKSDMAKDTVIQQSVSGSIKRDDNILLTFSYGEELGFEEVSLIDFTNKSKFEVIFFMKQHQLKYELDSVFSSKIKKGYAVGQSVKEGEVVSINGEAIKISISKGPKIEVPDFTNYTMAEVTEWAIKNKVKIHFTNQYDDSIKKDLVVSSDYSKGDVIEEGTVINIVISKGSLVMPKFESVNDFYNWASEYNITYEEEHEFSDSVPAGEVIRYSYEKGDSIKNGDTVIVTISDGKKIKVPNLIDLTKSQATSKLDNTGLKYNYIYRNSLKDKDVVIAQSLTAGSEVSNGLTITVTLSNGKAPSKNEQSTNKNNNNSNSNTVQKNIVDNNNSNNNSNNNNTNTSNNTSSVEVAQPSCKSCTFIKSQISLTIQQYDNCQAAASGLKSFLEGECPGLRANVSCRDVDGFKSMDFVDGFRSGTTDSCSTISITLAK